MNHTLKSLLKYGTLSLLLIGNSAQAGWSDWFSFKRAKEIVPMNNPEYTEECGSCHFPYQGGLLPAASWRKVMDAKQLADHFGDNAELDEDVRTRLLKLLEASAADDAHSKRSRKIMASLKGATPMRITEVPYIKDRHHEIPDNLIKGNPKVKSLSQCQRCHQEIKDGTYDDDSVYIPGHGYW